MMVFSWWTYEDPPKKERIPVEMVIKKYVPNINIRGCFLVLVIRVFFVKFALLCSGGTQVTFEWPEGESYATAKIAH